MKSISTAALVFVLASPAAGWAQHAPDLIRIDTNVGMLITGEIAEVDFTLDAGNFGGQVISRTNGFLDIDPSLSYGVRGNYRINDRLAVNASWTHSEGRFRIQFPAEASVSGNFDLEGLLLAGDAFVSGGDENSRAERAMSDAFTDVYRAAASYEFPVFNGWAFPFLTLGAGIYKQRSDGPVIQFEYAGQLPQHIESIRNQGGTWAQVLGLSHFAIDDLDPMVSFGGGFRVAFSQRWGVNVSAEDLIRVSADVSYIDAASTGNPDPDNFQLYSTTLRGKSGSIHNWSVQLSMNYALWPDGSPR